MTWKPHYQRILTFFMFVILANAVISTIAPMWLTLLQAVAAQTYLIWMESIERKFKRDRGDPSLIGYTDQQLMDYLINNKDLIHGKEVINFVSIGAIVFCLVEYMTSMYLTFLGGPGTIPVTSDILLFLGSILGYASSLLTISLLKKQGKLSEEYKYD